VLNRKFTTFYSRINHSRDVVANIQLTSENKMKFIQIILILILISSCGKKTKHIENGKESTEKSQAEIRPTEKMNSNKFEKKIGLELFKSILDTVKIETITKKQLINNEWIYKPFDSCESHFKFKNNGTGVSYNCEMEEDYEMTFRIDENKVYISEYNIPHVENKERKKIKFRDDIFIYNGKSLLMVNSKMYNNVGLEWTPNIEVVIEYERKKN